MWAFESREDDALLVEGGTANVRVWYIRTYNVSARNIHRKQMLLPKFASYSMSNKLH